MLIEDGRIVAVGTVEELAPAAADAEVVDASGHAVLPGLHNTHLHSGLLRGTAESKSLWDWLRDYVDPAHKALTPEIAEAASLLCCTESLRAVNSLRGVGTSLHGRHRPAGGLPTRYSHPVDAVHKDVDDQRRPRPEAQQYAVLQGQRCCGPRLTGSTTGGSLASTGVTVLSLAALAAALMGAGWVAYRRGRSVI